VRRICPDTSPRVIAAALLNCTYSGERICGVSTQVFGR
jgi:hypothetical protein